MKRRLISFFIVVLFAGAARGNVTGFSWLSSPASHAAGVHAFRYADGTGMTDVGALPPGNVSSGSGINSGSCQQPTFELKEAAN